MATNEELFEEIRKLRSELEQIREVVNTLFNMVIEEFEEEELLPDRPDNFSIYN
jgi:hypothetical protein